MYSLLFLFLLPASPRQEGIPPSWEAREVLEEAQKQTRNLVTALARLNTEHWKGDYTPLLVSTRQRVTAVADALDRLARQPERLSLGVEAFLSLQHIETNLDSLARGAERFEPAAVGSLEEASAGFLRVREKFQNYLLALARYTEKSLAVEEKELESCRDQLWKRPPGRRQPPRSARPGFR